MIQNICSVHNYVNIIMVRVRRCETKFSALLCKAFYILEQPRVGSGNNWFKTGPAYDIIKHLYIISK